MNSKSFVRKSLIRTIGIVSLAAIGVMPIFAQKLRITTPLKQPTDGFSWVYVLILAVGIVLGAAIFQWFSQRKNKKEILKETLKPKTPDKTTDVKQEIEWSRKNSKNLGRAAKKQIPSPKPFGKTSGTRLKSNAVSLERGGLENQNGKTETPARMPVFGIKRIELARPFAPLPSSEDEYLLSAIEQASEEFEEDSEIRQLALKILAAFKTSNSVEAISQIALYDLSSILRAKAVSVLAEFNHESVFETILLACADPGREVRAAAARGLFRLNFERTEAWLRIAESVEAGRARQSARALIAGDLVERTLERLIHQNKQYAAEAVAIVVLLIKGGETAEIFRYLQNQRNENIRKAILHVLKITNDQNALDELFALLEKSELTVELREEIVDALQLTVAAA